jgi:hypothetical protein
MITEIPGVLISVGRWLERCQLRAKVMSVTAVKKNSDDGWLIELMKPDLLCGSSVTCHLEVEVKV